MIGRACPRWDVFRSGVCRLSTNQEGACVFSAFLLVMNLLWRHFPLPFALNLLLSLPSSHLNLHEAQAVDVADPSPLEQSRLSYGHDMAHTVDAARSIGLRHVDRTPFPSPC